MRFFTDRSVDMAPKENPITFKCDDGFNDWLCKAVGRSEMDRSKFMRKAIHTYGTLLSIYPEFESVSVERLLKSPELVRKILVILEEV